MIEGWFRLNGFFTNFLEKTFKVKIWTNPSLLVISIAFIWGAIGLATGILVRDIANLDLSSIATFAGLFLGGITGMLLHLVADSY